MSNLIEWARFATEQEEDSFYAYLKRKNNEKNNFTEQWLLNNGRDFLILHENFKTEYLEFKHSEHIEKEKERFKKIVAKIKDFTTRKHNLGRCICQGNEIYIEGQYNNFIGCDNYREAGFKHTSITEPIWRENIPYPYEFTTQYLFLLKEFYDLPKELKESLLYEYLLLNNVTPIVDLHEKYNIVRDTKNKSNRRENIIKTILEKKYKKVYYQRMIKAKINGIVKTLIPDFICLNVDSCDLIEQKKNKYNIDENKTKLYIECLKYIANKPNNNIKFNIIYLVEEGETDNLKGIINLQSILS
jgi:ssDNA-binding Zn-finger/Zn-ribbon topoisomerase 1